MKLNRASPIKSLHSGGDRNLESLAETLQLTNVTAGMTLIFVDDVLTTGATFKSVRIVLKALECAPTKVHMVALAKTCSNSVNHNTPDQCTA